MLLLTCGYALRSVKSSYAGRTYATNCDCLILVWLTACGSLCFSGDVSQQRLVSGPKDICLKAHAGRHVATNSGLLILVSDILCVGV